MYFKSWLILPPKVESTVANNFCVILVELLGHFCFELTVFNFGSLLLIMGRVFKLAAEKKSLTLKLNNLTLLQVK